MHGLSFAKLVNERRRRRRDSIIASLQAASVEKERETAHSNITLLRLMFNAPRLGASYLFEVGLESTSMGKDRWETSRESCYVRKNREIERISFEARIMTSTLSSL
jgi:hypothetical protein